MKENLSNLSSLISATNVPIWLIAATLYKGDNTMQPLCYGAAALFAMTTFVLAILILCAHFAKSKDA
jgi:hypothetical protein